MNEKLGYEIIYHLTAEVAKLSAPEIWTYEQKKAYAQALMDCSGAVGRGVASCVDAISQRTKLRQL